MDHAKAPSAAPAKMVMGTLLLGMASLHLAAAVIGIDFPFLTIYLMPSYLLGGLAFLFAATPLWTEKSGLRFSTLVATTGILSVSVPAQFVWAMLVEIASAFRTGGVSRYPRALIDEPVSVFYVLVLAYGLATLAIAIFALVRYARANARCRDSGAAAIPRDPPASTPPE